MPVVWSAGAPNLVLKGISAQLQSQICLSPGLVGFVGVAEVSATVGVLWRPSSIAALVGFAALLIGAVRFHARDYADPKLRTQAITAVALFLVSATAAVILVLTMSPN